MTHDQIQAFYDASGIRVQSLSFDIRLMVGCVLVICALLILVGLLQLTAGSSARERIAFVIGLLSLSVLMMWVMMILA